MPLAANRSYMATLEMEAGTDVRLHSGDRVKINFDPEEIDPLGEWTGYVIEHMPMLTTHLSLKCTMSTPYLEPIGEPKLAEMTVQRDTMINRHGCVDWMPIKQRGIYYTLC
jgi:hypothetical protein